MRDGRLDEKGRLKLPVEFARYLNSLPEKKLFVTSLDRRIAQIYPIAVWRENEKFFHTHREHAAEVKRTAFNANELGEDSEVDSQGRVLFNTTLRTELDLQNQKLHMYSYRGRIQVIPEVIYQQWRAEASKTAEADLEVLEREGLQ